MSYYHKPFRGICAHILYTLATLLLGFYLGARSYQYLPEFDPITKAIAQIHPSSNTTTTGTVIFEQQKGGVHVSGQIHNLTPGKHGFHIHEYGDGSCVDAMCTGEHFNPTHAPHGGRDTKQRHIGDFGNVEADQNGTASIDFIDTDIQLNGPDTIVGRALIVHADEDDLISQPSGNSGKRIGCGIIGRTK